MNTDPVYNDDDDDDDDGSGGMVYLLQSQRIKYFVLFYYN
jgi:hypothetical protein